MTAEIEVFRDTGAILVESIWWDARTDEVVWVDISAGLLHRGPLDGSRDGGDDRVVELPPPVSAVQPAVGGGYIAALKDSVVLLDAAGRIDRELARLPHRHDGMRLNEGKVDPFGRFVVGAMELTSDDAAAAVWSVDAAGAVSVIRGGFGVANGFEWDDDGATMFITDTSTSTVYRGAYGADGRLGDLAPFLVGRMSDGLVRASDGTFYNGIYGDGSVVHWNADGSVAREVSVPAPNVTSVAFVGPALDQLLIGSARENLEESQLREAPLSGGIFRWRPGATGRPVHTFGSR
ncbi:SMP-30/gluconolactonase/LRE family protein [Microbacterium radiodurans]|uniref:SMP-30/gluconolactonase/LRE family protein n=1 Tax=Microbacterium radiodurans TaxID=661398 RepID=A0A5J5IX42_9MICO|nr:SMP-30/gluconolactonase/LRE family protein [Microbacterium radiodurans]KAA9089856.1 SMP-30/gluconolactonase/LRE family protein [Microbacterium radiodurans]